MCRPLRKTRTRITGSAIDAAPIQAQRRSPKSHMSVAKNGTLATMNPANGSDRSSANSITGQGPTFGNAFPMFGTGQTIYGQIGYLLPKTVLNGHGKLMPYASTIASKFDRLGGLWTNTYSAGINYFVAGQHSKITLDWQNRPVYEVNNSMVSESGRRNSVTMQYQIYF